jgi:hypothetical protein
VKRLAIVSLVLVVVVACWWLQRPSYLELPIPIRVSPHLDSFWRETHFTQVHYAGSWGALYICRKTGDAHREVQGWKTTTEVMAFFDHWLQQHGWHYQENSSLWDSILPEARFLPMHVQFRLYARSVDRSWEGPWVAVAIDPIYEGAFDVTLVTIQPSWLRRLDESFD